MSDELHDHLIAFTDDAMKKIAELEERITKLEKALETILKGHEGNTRDELKTRLEQLEEKIHGHFEAVKKAQQLGGQATA